MEQQKGLKHGVYEIFWKEGRSSVASIGFTNDGTNWFSPCNWTSQSNESPMVASTNWEGVESIKLIKENNYGGDMVEDAKAGDDKCLLCGVPNRQHGTCCGWHNAAVSVNEDGIITDKLHPQYNQKHPYLAAVKSPSSIEFDLYEFAKYMNQWLSDDQQFNDAGLHNIVDDFKKLTPTNNKR